MCAGVNILDISGVVALANSPIGCPYAHRHLSYGCLGRLGPRANQLQTSILQRRTKVGEEKLDIRIVTPEETIAAASR
jgi:hypothetical protein